MSRRPTKPRPVPDRARLAELLRRLVLRQTAWTCCETASAGAVRFLQTVWEAEVAHREAVKRTRLITRAGFPALKTLETFDRRAVQLPASWTWADLETGTYLTAHRNRVCYGPVGTGKSHLGIALGLRACEAGLPVRCFTVTDWVVRLTEAKRAGTLERVFQDLRRTERWILDEWGYLPIDREGAQLLFRVVADSYETRSLIITTNLACSTWGTVLTDDPMAAAILDRLAHHGHLLLFQGESYRMTHALMREGYSEG